MGAVFTARNVRTERRVALKLLHPESRDRLKAIERFQREARAAGMISSENVTQVLDAEDDPDFGLVIAFELLEGESLLGKLRRDGPISFTDLYPLIQQTLRGLADAHAAGIVHRDLKPSNIFLEERPGGNTRVKILDFGISKLPKPIAKITLTEPGQSLGSLLFMPPEQVYGAVDVDSRADLYALGTVVFQALTGQLPFAYQTAAELLRLKSQCEARTLSEVLGHPAPPALDAWVARSLMREPSARFSSTLEALDSWLRLDPTRLAARPSMHPLLSPTATPEMPLSAMPPLRSARTSLVPISKRLSSVPPSPRPQSSLASVAGPRLRMSPGLWIFVSIVMLVVIVMLFLAVWLVARA